MISASWSSGDVVRMKPALTDGRSGWRARERGWGG